MKVVALAGGTGAAKLLRGLVRLIDPRDLTIVVNTGDDAQIWGLHVSPDLDTVVYTLAGRIDETKGWGVRDETFHALEHMARFGEPSWFSLGDRDLATHLYRTRLLREGKSLSEATRAIAASLGVTASVLPMSDQPVRTRLLGPDGWLDFQEYFVREKTQVEVRRVGELLGAGTVVWISNVIAFALLYWELDSGGAAARAHGLPAHPDLAFPQQLNPGVGAPGLAAAVRRLPVPRLHQRDRVQPHGRHAARTVGQARDDGPVPDLARPSSAW